jgi:hypothetical protein
MESRFIFAAKTPTIQRFLGEAFYITENVT